MNIERALEDPMVLEALPRYAAAAGNKVPVNFQIAKRISFDFDKSLNDQQLWASHEELMQKFYQTRHFLDLDKLDIKELEVPRFSLLDLKYLLTEQIMNSCDLCERACLVNRTKGEMGKCGVKECMVSSEFVHMGEEPFISPSHAIFFMGCNFNCQFCQNYSVSQWLEKGHPVTARYLAERMEKMWKQGCRNVNFVGGEPTPSLMTIIKALWHCQANVPVVWNSNFYMSVKTMKILEGLVDLYLSDFKYGNDRCASKFSMAKNYVNIVSRNHLLAAGQAELTVRHLVLPGHIECCSKPILNWIAENLADKCIVNVMGQYRPEYKAEQFMDIRRTVTKEELKEVVKHARKLKINYMV